MYIYIYMYIETYSPAGSGPRTCYIRPSEQVQKYKKPVLNYGDFMNEFKLHLTRIWLSCMKLLYCRCSSCFVGFSRRKCQDSDDLLHKSFVCESR